MTHALVSFLGKARLDARTGYRTARYRLADDAAGADVDHHQRLKESPNR